MVDLHPEVREVLARLAAEKPPEVVGLPAAEARALRSRQPAWLRLAPRPVARTEDRAVPGPNGPIPLRVYVPQSALSRPTPLVVYFHGGAYMFGDLDTDDPQCRLLAEVSGCILVSVDYRLAPEHRFPAGLEDAYAATEWVAAHAAELGGDGARIAVAGASAGGNFAAAVTHLARERGGPHFTFRLAFQLLIVPNLGPFPGVASHARLDEGLGLPRAFHAWATQNYIRSDADRADPRYAPLLAKQFSRLPPAMVIVAGADPFLDEGLQYAQKLRDAGVPVEVLREEGQIHQMHSWAGAFSAGPRMLERGALALRRALAA